MQSIKARPFVGELDLIQRILEQFHFQPLGPWSGQLVLIEEAESHEFRSAGS
jgi:hypothetical protein